MAFLFSMIYPVYTLLFFCIIASLTSAGQTAQMAQYPSPMQEKVRKHERVSFDTKAGKVIILDSVLSKPVTIYIPKKLSRTKPADLLIHFHGSSSVVAYAAENYKGNLVAVSVTLGSGSGVYSSAFRNDSSFTLLENAVWTAVSAKLNTVPKKGRLILSGFSAGYGAIRSILGQPGHFEEINAVLLLDGLHASYIPERKTIAEGGLTDSVSLEPFTRFAKEAISRTSGKKFLFTHSEIFPGTFVSTTEAATCLLQQLKMQAKPVLKWGPGGMQQISEAQKGNFMIWGFAGNSAPDHIDHFQNLYFFINKIRR